MVDPASPTADVGARCGDALKIPGSAEPRVQFATFSVMGTELLVADLNGWHRTDRQHRLARNESGSVNAACGTHTFTGSGGFSGRQLQMSFAYVSQTCYNMNVTISLSR